jgi:hypothetical protein
MTYLFFALSVPVMVKVLLPAALRSQFPGMSDADLALMIDISQLGSMANYLKNTFEIGLIIVVFTLAGLMATEIKDNTLVMPLCSGRQFAPILLSKFLVHTAFLTVITFVALSVTYYYSGILFDNEIAYTAILKTALLESVLMSFVVSMVLLLGTFVQKPIPTGLVTIGLIYLLMFVASLLDIQAFLPIGLHQEAATFTSSFSGELFGTIAITIALTLGVLVLTMRRLQTMEWNQR